MIQVTYRSPTPDDIVTVAAEMRLSDVMEVAASHGRSPIDALVIAVRDSTAAIAVLLNGKPVGIFGVAHHGGMSAEVWLLGTDNLTRHHRSFQKETARILDAWGEMFGVMHNFVDDENEVAKAWLKRSGFTLGEPRPYGVAQVPFRYFYRVGSGV